MKAALLALGLLVAVSSAEIVSASENSKRSPSKDAAPATAKNPKGLTDAQIKQLMIDESIAAYSGNCPCPYNLARNGSRCGRRSAYDREGGASPLCYPKDISAEMVQEYRDAHKAE